MMKFQIELHDHHFALLQQMAAQEYRDPKQQAAWVIGCAVSASAVIAQDDVMLHPLPEESHDGS